jgi:2'-5' RNA ligase
VAIELNRLFFALWPTDEVREACARAARDLKIRMQPGGYLSAAERYHLTLLFLGDAVSPEKQAAALAAASRFRGAPFELLLDHAGSFRNRQIPWWLGARELPRELNQLHDRLRETLVRADATPDRMKFVPHLTILRDAQAPLPTTAIKPVRWKVEEFVLVRSRLDLRPMHYELLGRWPLNGAAEPEPAAQLDLWG